MRTSYDDKTKKTKISAEIAGLSFDQYIALCRYLRSLQEGADPLDDATRPAGTPTSDYRRTLEDAVQASGGQLTVTHAAGGEPVLVPAADEPVGIPAEQFAAAGEIEITPIEKTETVEAEDKPKAKATRKKRKPPTNKPKTVAQREQEEADQRAEHAQRWRGKTRYKNDPSPIVGYAVKGVELNVVLELANGEKIWLDENDAEIKREAPTDKLPDDEAAMGDFRPNDGPPVSTPQPVAPTRPPVEVPPEIANSERFGQLVDYYLRGFDVEPADEKYFESIAGLVKKIVGVGPYLNNPKFNRLSGEELHDRAINVFKVRGALNADQANQMKTEWAPQP